MLIAFTHLLLHWGIGNSSLTLHLRWWRRTRKSRCLATVFPQKPSLLLLPRWNDTSVLECDFKAHVLGSDVKSKRFASQPASSENGSGVKKLGALVDYNDSDSDEGEYWVHNKSQNPSYVISILSCCLLPRERQLGWRQLAAQQKTEDCGSNRWGCRGVPLEAACLRVSLVLVFIGGSSLPSSLNISSDFLQYFGTNLCPCWDNGKWKSAIELQNATKYLQELTQDPVWGITSVKGHIGQSEPSIVAATCLLKTFRLSIKCRSPPLWSGQKLPFDINICCLPGCHGYSFRSQLIVFLTWIK